MGKFTHLSMQQIPTSTFSVLGWVPVGSRTDVVLCSWIFPSGVTWVPVILGLSFLLLWGLGPLPPIRLHSLACHQRIQGTEEEKSLGGTWSQSSEHHDTSLNIISSISRVIHTYLPAFTKTQSPGNQNSFSAKGEIIWGEINSYLPSKRVDLHFVHGQILCSWIIVI